MDKKTFCIGSTAICGAAYDNAICEVMSIVNDTLGTKYFYARDWAVIDTLAEKLGIRFNENGEIAREG